MAKRSSEIQAKYDATHSKRYSMKFHVINDEEVINKLSSVPSVQGYVRQLVMKDIGSAPDKLSDIIPISSDVESIITEEADRIGKSVPDLIALIVDTWVINQWRISTDSAPKKKAMEKTMKTYHIKPEYLALWEGGDSPSVPDRVVTEYDVRTFSKEWEVPVETLLEQLIPCD